MVAVVLVALNQRPAIVGVAPVLLQLRADTGLSSALGGLLTTLPVLAFGAFSPLAPKLARWIGLEVAVAASLLLLAGGIALRVLSPVALLYAGSLLAGAAIAIANVLMPAYVKREFSRPGLMMGVYSASLNIGAAAAAALTVPIGMALGVSWRVALGSWLLLALAALVVWLGITRPDRATSPPAMSVGGAWELLRQGLARHVTAFLGLQSVQFYSVAAWLPTVLADAGIPVDQGGALLGLTNLLGAGAALLLPALAGRMAGQRPLVLVVSVAYVIGLTGLMLTPGAGTLAWVAVFGVAQGGGFSLALTLIVLRSPTPLTSARLGGVAQALGYLLAAAGPIVLGALHDGTDSWAPPLALLLVLVAPMVWTGWGAARDSLLTDGPAGEQVPRT